MCREIHYHAGKAGMQKWAGLQMQTGLRLKQHFLWCKFLLHESKLLWLCLLIACSNPLNAAPKHQNRVHWLRLQNITKELIWMGRIWLAYWLSNLIGVIAFTTGKKKKKSWHVNSPIRCLCNLRGQLGGTKNATGIFSTCIVGIQNS